MGTLVQKIRDVFWGEPNENGNGMAPAMRITVQCECGEKISTRIEKAYDLQGQYLPAEDEDEAKPPVIVGYLLRKELVGSRCQNPVRVTVQFDADKRPTDHSVEGGEWISAEECA